MRRVTFVSKREGDIKVVNEEDVEHDKHVCVRFVARDEDDSLIIGLVGQVPEGGDARLVDVDSFERMSEDLV